MITGVQPKILVGISEEPIYNWRLVREQDGLTKQSRDIIWIEWNEEGRFKARHDDIAVGRSLMMSPFNEAFTWQTTVVTEILASTPDEDYIKFKTTNSTYELYRLYDAPTGNPV